MDEETVRRIVFDAVQIAVTQIAAAATVSATEVENSSVDTPSPTLTLFITSR